MNASDPSANTSGPVEDDDGSPGWHDSALFSTKPARAPKNDKFRHYRKNISFNVNHLRLFDWKKVSMTFYAASSSLDAASTIPRSLSFHLSRMPQKGAEAVGTTPPPFIKPHNRLDDLARVRDDVNGSDTEDITELRDAILKGDTDPRLEHKLI
ncbi:hypothetical protein ACLOJK_034171 [Asimina triloba]